MHWKFNISPPLTKMQSQSVISCPEKGHPGKGYNDVGKNKALSKNQSNVNFLADVGRATEDIVSCKRKPMLFTEIPIETTKRRYQNGGVWMHGTYFGTLGKAP